MRNEAAAIELGENAGEADFPAQGLQAFGNRLGGADQCMIAQAILITQAAQLVDAAHAPGGGFRVDQPRRAFEQVRLLVVEMHDAFPGFGAGALLSLGNIGRRRDEDLAAAGMAGFFPGVVICLDLLGEVVPSRVAHRGEDRRPRRPIAGKVSGVLAAMRIGGVGFW